jgi:predicted RNase H-like HicB family nuclease
MLTIELEQEDDGRWFGDVPELPGCMAYGRTKDEAERNTEALAFRVIADRLEHGEQIPVNPKDYFVAA